MVGPVTLLDGGSTTTYATIADALAAAQDGDTIQLAAGTYTEHVVIDKAVTIQGAQSGTDGRGRGASDTGESILAGGVKIVHDGVTLDGVEIKGSYDSQTIDGTDLPNGLLVAANNATITNSVFIGDTQDSRPFSVAGGDTGLSFTKNLVKSWAEGAYLVDGSTGTVSNNTFLADGNGVLSESTGVQITNNNFDSTGATSPGADVAPLPFTDANIGNYVSGNTYTPGKARPITVYLNGPDGQTVTGTDVPTTYDAEYHTGSSTVTGGSGADRFIDSSNPANVATFVGGGGNDTYDISNRNTVIDESAGGGTDQVNSSVDYTLPSNVENLTLNDVSSVQTFDNLPNGPITNGEDGWVVLGDPTTIDENVVDRGSGNKALEISSNPGNAGFAGPYTPGLSGSAGEPQTGAASQGETVSFQIQAVNPTPDGSRLEIDFGNTSATDRNNFLVVESSPDSNGLRIAVSQPDASGNFPDNIGNSFPTDDTQLASGIDPTVAHTITMQVTYNNGVNIDGSGNDSVDIFLDGKYISGARPPSRPIGMRSAATTRRTRPPTRPTASSSGKTTMARRKALESARASISTTSRTPSI